MERSRTRLNTILLGDKLRIPNFDFIGFDFNDSESWPKKQIMLATHLLRRKLNNFMYVKMTEISSHLVSLKKVSEKRTKAKTLSERFCHLLQSELYFRLGRRVHFTEQLL